MYCTSSCLVAIAAGFVSSVVAQSFSQPDLSASSGEIVQYTVGQQVQVAWTSPWDYTKVGVYQVDPAAYYQIANASSTTTSITWVAQNFANADLSTQTFFFRLSDGTDDSQPSYDSGNFALTDAVAAASTTSGAASSSTSSVSATSTSASTTSSVSSSSAAAATSPAASSDAGTVPAVASTNPVDNLNYTSSFLGVGLGLGIPFLLAIVAAVVLFIRNKRKSKQAAVDPEMSQAPVS